MGEKDTCLSCQRLLECSRTSEMCEKYQYGELNKTALSAKYLKSVKKLNEAIQELKEAEVGLDMLEKTKDEKAT